jgi:pSer/pThr/pTyr-binding forkhead associated (FHA) protein
MSKLVCENGQEFVVDSFSVIGRNPNTEQFGGQAKKFEVNDTSKTISKTHAALAVDQNGRVLIEDLNSTNGTFIEGVDQVETQVENGEPQSLEAGQRLRLGDVYFALV